MYSVPAAERHRALQAAPGIDLPDRFEPAGRDRASQTTPDRDGDHPGLTQALISLLNNAEECLDKGSPAAKSCIDRALSLLEAERQRRRAPSPTIATPAKGGLSPWRVRRIEEHIDEHLGGTILIPDLTAIAHLSVRHFSMAFKQSFGQPPHAYIVRRRIEKAQQMMLLSDEPLSQIALACGLADQAHLSKWFRRLAGVTPNAWRKERRA
jgi:AraC family transcriptional regulator